MKKLLLSSLLTVGLVSTVMGQVYRYPYSASVTLHAGQMTNLVLNASRAGTIVVTAPTATNASVTLVDTYNGFLTNYVSPFTNTISYATNVVTYYTNYFGVTTLLTNFGLVDVTNNLVPAYTNVYPQTALATLASTSTRFDNMNAPFYRGIWATNTGSGDVSVTVYYILQ